MIKFKQLFKEKVPFDKRGDVSKGLNNKFGVLEPYTFGFDVELKIEGELKSADEIYDILRYEYDKFLENDRLTKFVDDEVDELWGDVDVESYFGISIPDYSDYNDWEEDNPPPKDSESDEGKDWLERSEDIEQQIDDYNSSIEHHKSEFKEENVHNILNRISNDPDEYLNYITPEGDVDISDNVDHVSDILDINGYDGWTVEDDGDNNIELTSPILKNDDISIAKEVLNAFIEESGGSGHDSSSAHIHIGVPDSFDVFDMLVLYDIVDEDKLNSIQPSRDTSFTKGKSHMFRMIESSLKKNKSLDIDEPIVITVEKLESIMRTGDRYMGVNLTNVLNNGAFSKERDDFKKTGKRSRSISGKSIEFRYLSSEILDDISEFFEWIEYFQMIMKVAESRSQITFKNKYAEGDRQYTTITRVGGDKIRVKYGKSDKRPDRPTREIKS